jgi:hypothetical protein
LDFWGGTFFVSVPAIVFKYQSREQPIGLVPSTVVGLQFLPSRTAQAADVSIIFCGKKVRQTEQQRFTSFFSRWNRFARYPFALLQLKVCRVDGANGV